MEINLRDAPPAPKVVRDGVIDDGAFRWRFELGRLKACMRYRPLIPSDEYPNGWRIQAIWA